VLITGASQGLGKALAEARALGALLLSTDPVAADATFCRLVDLDPEHVPTCTEGARAGLGSWQAGEIELREGIPADFFLPDFRVTRDGLLKYYPRLRHLLFAHPVIDPALCRRCGDCVRVRPVPDKAMRFEERRAPSVFDCRRCPDSLAGQAGHRRGPLGTALGPGPDRKAGRRRAS
jgi:ferredoxin